MSVLFDVNRRWFKQNLAWSNTRRAWIDRLAGLGLFFGFAALLWFSRRLSTTQIVVSSGLLCAAGAIMARRGWVRLFGPILFFDLVRTARRNRYFVIRYVCLLTLFALLFFVHWTLNFGEVARDWNTGEAQQFTMTYFLVFVVIQSIFLVILGPAYVAGSIAEEKERKTLEFMLATDLDNREIVFGKLLSRLGNLLFIFLSGLPFLSILQFLGGIDPTLVVAWAATTAVGLISLSCLCMLNSVLNRKSRDAIAISYFCVLGYLILSGASWLLTTHALAISWITPTELEKVLYVGSAGNPLVLATFATDEVNIGHPIEAVLMKYVRDFTIFHTLIALVACLLSVLALRSCALNQSTDRTRRRFRIRWPRPRVLSESMLWKELFVERSLYVNLIGRIVFCLLLAVAVATFWYSLDSPRAMTSDVIASWVQVVGMLGACMLLLSVAGRASTSISHERDKETIDGLLTTPVNTDSILFAKWLGAVLSIRWGVLLLGVIYYLAILAGSVHWVTLPLMLIAWFIYASVVAMLGLWYSVVCRTSSSATVWTYLSTAGLGVGHWLDMLCMVPLFIAGQGGLRYLVLMQLGFTPPYALAVSLFVQESPGGRVSNPDTSDQLVYGLAGLGAWAVIAVLLWLVTSSRFHLMCGRSTLVEPPADPTEATLESLPDGGLAPATNG
jgi:ABC-type transport system involved in multi-copper enzyme maturation permease subunit